MPEMDSKTTTKFDQQVVKTTDKEGSENDSVEGKQQSVYGNSNNRPFR